MSDEAPPVAGAEERARELVDLARGVAHLAAFGAAEAYAHALDEGEDG